MSMHEELDATETNARIAKLMAETAKLNRETLFYPIIVTATVILALAAIMKLFV